MKVRSVRGHQAIAVYAKCEQLYYEDEVRNHLFPIRSYIQ